MPSPTGPATSRRTVLSGALTAALASGCDDASPGADPDPGASTPPAGDPDEVLVDDVVGEVGALLALVTGALSARPVLRPRLRGLLELHRAHLAVLPDREPAPGPLPLPGSPEAVVRAVLAREEQGRRRLADWAVAAESGTLARLLAAMSAGIAARARATEPGA